MRKDRIKTESIEVRMRICCYRLIEITIFIADSSDSVIAGQSTRVFCESRIPIRVNSNIIIATQTAET